MGRNKHLGWLYDELDGLIEEGVITEETARRLRAHYGELPAGRWQYAALAISGVLGALLVAAGIVLLLAHNWQGLPRPLRVGVALAPLLVAQALCGWVLLRRRGSVAWREGSGTALCAGVFLAVSLIGQTYQIPGDPADLLLTCSLLVIAGVYLLDSFVVALLYVVAITFWAGLARHVPGHAPGFWPLAALVAPYLWRRGRREHYGAPTAFLFWGTAVCATFGLGLAFDHAFGGVWIVAYSAMFALMHLGGRRRAPEGESFWRAPFKTAGALGIGVVSLILTFEAPWQDVWQARVAGPFAWPAAVDCAVTGLLLVGVVLLLTPALTRRTGGALYGAAPLLAVCALAAIALCDAYGAVMVAYNIYLFALGIGTLARGLRDERIATANGGLGLLVMLIVARFFDAEVSFTVRGVAFTAVGIGFLIANLLILRRWKGAGS